MLSQPHFKIKDGVTVSRYFYVQHLNVQLFMKLSPLSELEKPYTEESVKYKSNSIHNKAGFEMIKNNVVANESFFLISKLHSVTKMVEGFIFTDLRHEIF